MRIDPKILPQNSNFSRVSNSAWCHKIRPVEKEDGTVRITTNFIRLNQKVLLDKYSLPNLEEMLYALRDQAYFSKIDLKDGFFQVSLREGDRHKTAFRVKNRLYEWTRMPMGLKNSPAVFQRLMDAVLRQEIKRMCVVYDILIFGKTEREHDVNMLTVIKKLVETGLRANQGKCVFK